MHFSDQNERNISVDSIVIRDIRKQFGKKEVLKGISLMVPEGAACGLLGKNGAGKTTLNRILTGLAFPTSGSAAICGETPGRGQIAYLSENISIFPGLTAYENIEQMFLLDGMKPQRPFILKLLDRIEIENNKKKAGHFSLGMKRRLQIGMSMLTASRPVMILDEPTNGLDINGVLWLKETIRKLKSEGTTMLITSHAIRELEEDLTDYAILYNGMIVAGGKTDDLDGGFLVTEFDAAETDKALPLLDQKGLNYIRNGNELRIPCPTRTEEKEILSLLLAAGVTPRHYGMQKNSLVDVFRACTHGDEGEDSDA